MKSTILVTGGAGFLGKELLKTMDTNLVRVVARGEAELVLIKHKYPEIEIMTGDISDRFVCDRALRGIHTVFHLAAMKHIGLAEKQPNEAIRSNLLGTILLLERFKGRLFLAISTDKAAQVNGVYGATKFLMEKIIQEYSETYVNTEYRVVRYGNILYSTGSVLCKWKDALQNGKSIIVTEPKATRFFWSVDQAVQLIWDCIEQADGCTPYSPDMKAIKIATLLEAMQIKYGKASEIKVIGLQPGENLHEKIKEDGPYSNEVQLYTVEEVLELV
jgi:UDP-N-acetylglucosamine 4,6-dehydratase/UDP-glucose 4-epimerase